VKEETNQPRRRNRQAFLPKKKIKVPHEGERTFNKGGGKKRTGMGDSRPKIRGDFTSIYVQEKRDPFT